MKKLIILLLTLTLILCNFISCNNKRYHPMNDETIADDTSEFMYKESETTKIDETQETEEYVDTIDGIDTGGAQNEYNYTLEKVGSQWYMIFDEYVEDSRRPSYLYFETDSMKTIKQTIFNNELDEDQKSIIVSVCNRDEIGIPIPDILDPILPSNLIIYQAFWEKDRFVVSFIDKNYSDTGIDGAMYDLDEAGFTEKYNAAAKENIYVSEDGTKTIVLQQVKNQYIDRDYLYVKIGDDYALFELCGTPDYLDRDLIMSFGFEVLT